MSSGVVCASLYEMDRSGITDGIETKIVKEEE